MLGAAGAEAIAEAEREGSPDLSRPLHFLSEGARARLAQALSKGESDSQQPSHHHVTSWWVTGSDTQLHGVLLYTPKPESMYSVPGSDHLAASSTMVVYCAVLKIAVDQNICQACGGLC